MVCPKECISFGKTNMGRLYPVVGHECVDCGLCLKYCPSGYEHELKGIYNSGEIQEVYIGRATDKEYFENAQSGGACTATLHYLFSANKIDGAVVVRMDFGSTPEVQAVLVESIDELKHCQKSCYTAVPLLSILRQCEDKKSLAVVGLPCQMRALSSIQKSGKRLTNVKYKLGLFCDGTMTSVAQDVLVSYANRSETKEYKIDWKNKMISNYCNVLNYSMLRGGYESALTRIFTVDGQETILPNTYRFLLKELFTYPQCYRCNDKLNVNADIVFGDPWGMSNVDWQNGDNVILPRTAKGQALVDEMLSQHVITASEGDFEEIVKGQNLPSRLLRSKEEIKSNSYKNRFASLERSFMDKDEAVAYARKYIARKIKHKRKVYRIASKVWYFVKRKLR